MLAILLSVAGVGARRLFFIFSLSNMFFIVYLVRILILQHGPKVDAGTEATTAITAIMQASIFLRA